MTSASKDIGRAFLAGRLEWLRDTEREDVDALAKVLGEDSPVVVRMRQRVDELDRCTKVAEEIAAQ